MRHHTAPLLAGLAASMAVGATPAGALQRSMAADAAAVSPAVAGTGSKRAGSETPHTASGSFAAPSDPGFVTDQQWWLGGLAGNYVNAIGAWPRTEGSGVIVAVVDTGCDLTDADLAPNLWVNPSPGKDGPTDGLHGANFVAGNGDPQDDEGHGTGVAGVIGAAANGTGVVGLAPQATIMCVKVLDSKGNGDDATISEGIDYAVDHGARIVNLSLGGAKYSLSLETAILHAEAEGVLVVAAAGNSAADVSEDPSFPAGFEQTTTNVIGVAATTQGNTLASFSDYDSTGATLIAAPGDGIVTDGLQGYVAADGTSFAAPIVSATAALMLSIDPDLSPVALLRDMRAGADSYQALSGVVRDGLLVDAAGAVAATPDPIAPPAEAVAVSVARGAQIVRWTTRGAATARVVSRSLIVDGFPVAVRRSVGSVALHLRTGRHTVAVWTFSATGNETQGPTRTFVVRPATR